MSGKYEILPSIAHGKHFVVFPDKQSVKDFMSSNGFDAPIIKFAGSREENAVSLRDVPSDVIL